MRRSFKWLLRAPLVQHAGSPSSMLGGRHFSSPRIPARWVAVANTRSIVQSLTYSRHALRLGSTSRFPFFSRSLVQIAASTLQPYSQRLAHGSSPSLTPTSVPMATETEIRPADILNGDVAPPAGQAEQSLDPESDEDVPVEAEELKEALGRPPPVNSSYLPLPWKGRLGYVSCAFYLA